MDRPYIICCILSALDGKPPVHLGEQRLPERQAKNMPVSVQNIGPTHGFTER